MDRVGTTLGHNAHHTTAYHPQANGLVEQFHRQLKSSLRARLRGPNWSDELPWTMLGIRTAPKEDLGAPSAELVYGYPLTVPGDFLATSPTETPATLLPALRDTVRALVPVPTSRHGLVPSSVPQVLHRSAFVFVRRGAKSPLKSPYEGPFRVLHHGDKAFSIDVGGRQELVTVDRLKPAHLDLDQPIQVAAAPTPRSPTTISWTYKFHFWGSCVAASYSY